MGSESIYARRLSWALKCIRITRNPHMVGESVLNDPALEEIKNEALVSFDQNQIDQFISVLEVAKSHSLYALCFIVKDLFELYGVPFEEIWQFRREGLLETAYLILKDNRSDTLLVFKDIDHSRYFKVREPEEIQELLQRYNAKEVKYIYFMYEKAYYHVVGYNADAAEPDKKTGCFSFRWFIETYFGKEEYAEFLKNYNKYVKRANDYIDYVMAVSLTSGTLFFFKQFLRNQIVSFVFNRKKTYNGISLPSADYETLKKQFFNEKTYLLMLGKRDSSESFVTAEWLYDSFKKARAIDLTVIGTGYFKMIEQLLFELICLHKNEGRKIKKLFSRRDKVELNDNNLRKGIVDTSIGSMAWFFKENLDILRTELSDRGKEYTYEAIFDYRDIRNGFFHKENIHNWTKIEEIRDSSYQLMFIVLGAKKLNADQLKTLKIPTVNKKTDYQLLCEYMDYHRDGLFQLEHKSGNCVLMYARGDHDLEIINDEYIKYSGVYVRPIESRKDAVIRIPEDDLPVRIYLAGFDVQQTEDFEVSIQVNRKRLIFENGHYVGPSVLDEDFKY